MAIFANIIRVVIVFEDSKKGKRIKIMQSIFLFLDICISCRFSAKTADVSRTQGMCHVIHILFGSSLGKV